MAEATIAGSWQRGVGESLWHRVLRRRLLPSDFHAALGAGSRRQIGANCSSGSPLLLLLFYASRIFLICSRRDILLISGFTPAYGVTILDRGICSLDADLRAGRPYLSGPLTR